MENKTAAVILCAGKGTRMNDTKTHKVCYELCGKPVIIRQINNMKAAGIKDFVIVVGYKSELVIECLKGIDGVSFAYQETQNGTGSAALCGLKKLNEIGSCSNAFISMGDKIISSDIIKKMIEAKKISGHFPIISAQTKPLNPDGGRIIYSNGSVYGVIEKADSFLLLLAENGVLTEEEYRNILNNSPLNEKKKDKIIKIALSLGANLKSKYELNGHYLCHDEIEKSEYINAGAYVTDISETIKLLSSLGSTNAQGEIYLTDIVEKYAPLPDNCIFKIVNDGDMITYSTIDELKSLERYYENEL